MSLTQACAAAQTFPIPQMSTIRQKRLVSLIRALNGFKQAVDNGKYVSELISDIIDASSLSLSMETDTSALSRFFEAAEQYQGTVHAWLRELALNKDVDYYHPGAEKVALLTMHSAKGLEFPVVFIAGCENELIPYRHPGSNHTDTEEERRLFYVAMTRAKERLIVSWSTKRTVLGRTRQRTLSPFVESIEDRLKEKLAVEGGKTPQRQLSLFD